MVLPFTNGSEMSHQHFDFGQFRHVYSSCERGVSPDPVFAGRRRQRRRRRRRWAKSGNAHADAPERIVFHRARATGNGISRGSPRKKVARCAESSRLNATEASRRNGFPSGAGIGAIQLLHQRGQKHGHAPEIPPPITASPSTSVSALAIASPASRRTRRNASRAVCPLPGPCPRNLVDHLPPRARAPAHAPLPPHKRGAPRGCSRLPRHSSRAGNLFRKQPDFAGRGDCRRGTTRRCAQCRRRTRCRG